MTIPEIFTVLEKQCDDSLKIIDTVNKPEYLETDEKKTIRDLVVMQAFMRVFNAWEQFLENSTKAYALGEKSLLGYSPPKYVNPLDEDHADRLIKGTNTYPDWTDAEKVLKIETAFFENGEPYTTALNGFSSKYKEIKKVRNEIAHNSKNSKDEFDTLVRNVLRASAVGISVTDFLLSRKHRTDPYFYWSYITYIKNAARLISEFKP